MANVAIITPRTHPNLGYLTRYLEEWGHNVFLFVETWTQDFELLEGSSTRVISKDQLSSEALLVILKEIEIAFVRSYTGFPGFVFRSLKKLGLSKLVEYSQSPSLVPLMPRFRDMIKAIYRKTRGRPLLSVTCVRGNNRKNPELDFTHYFPHPGPKIQGTAPEANERPSIVRVISIAKSGLPRKRIDLLLTALIRLGFQGELVIVGMEPALASSKPRTKIKRDERKYVRRLHHLVNLASMNFRIEEIKNLSHSKALELIGQADLFALPSVKEPFAISPLEAMAFGKTVVISSDNGAVDYVKHNQSGFVFAKDRLPQLMSCLRDAFEPEVRQRIGREASKTVAAMNADDRLALYVRQIVKE